MINGEPKQIGRLISIITIFPLTSRSIPDFADKQTMVGQSIP